MKLKVSNKGFTLIELIVVISILSLVLIAIGSINYGDGGKFQSIKLTGDSIVEKINSSRNNASTGYGGLAVGKEIKNDKELLPEDFIVFFQSDTYNSVNSTTMSLLQTQEREKNGGKFTRIIFKKNEEYPGKEFYLKKITVKKTEEDSGVETSNISVGFRNPLGNSYFILGNNSYIQEGNKILSERSEDTINEFSTPAFNNDYNIAYLDFYTIGEEKAFRVLIYRDKQAYLSLHF